MQDVVKTRFFFLMAAAAEPLASLAGCSSAPAEAQATASARASATIIADGDTLDPALAADAKIGQDYVRAFDAGVRIPASFRGHWSPDPATCAAADSHQATHLMIGGITLRNGDGIRVANRVDVSGDDALALSFTPGEKGAGADALPRRFHVSADGNRLFLLDAAGRPVGAGWVRCHERLREGE